MAQMQEAAGEAQQRLQQAAGEARGRAREQIDQRTTQAGERVSATAGDVRTIGEELRKQGKHGPARMADEMAERVDRLGGYLQQSDSDRLLKDVEDFGRRRPWAVAAGGLVLGFAASRFLKASSERRYRASRPMHNNDGSAVNHPPAAALAGGPQTGVGNAPGTASGSGFEPHR